MTKGEYVDLEGIRKFYFMLIVVKRKSDNFSLAQFKTVIGTWQEAFMWLLSLCCASILRTRLYFSKSGKLSHFTYINRLYCDNTFVDICAGYVRRHWNQRKLRLFIKTKQGNFFTL